MRHRLREAGAEYRVGRVASRRGGPGRDADRRRVILDLMRSALGAPLTAAITGVGSATAVNGRVSGRSCFDDDLDQRLRDAFDVTETLLQVESPEVVRAWLLGRNPMLDDRAPAAVLPEAPAAVLRAARYFAANG